MKVAFVIPSLANAGPILVVKDIVDCLDRSVVEYICIYYFDQIEEVEFNVPCRRIPFEKAETFEGFDLVHTHGYRPDRFAYKNRKRIKAKVVSTLHTNMYEEYQTNYNFIAGWLAQFVWLRALRRHDRIVVLSNQMRMHYAKHIDESRMTVIYNGRTKNTMNDIPEEDMKLIASFRNNYKVIGAACKISKRKGLHQVIKALPFIPDSVFLIIGNGKEREELAVLARKLKVSERCVFLGARLNAAAYFQFFDVYAMPSYSEGVPLALLEAASHGIPSICSDIAILREIFDETEVAFFELDNEESFVKAYQYVLKHGFLGDNMKKRYLESYTSNKMATNYLNLYCSML